MGYKEFNLNYPGVTQRPWRLKRERHRNICVHVYIYVYGNATWPLNANWYWSGKKWSDLGKLGRLTKEGTVYLKTTNIEFYELWNMLRVILTIIKFYIMNGL